METRPHSLLIRPASPGPFLAGLGLAPLGVLDTAGAALRAWEAVAGLGLLLGVLALLWRAYRRHRARRQALHGLHFVPRPAPGHHRYEVRPPRELQLGPTASPEETLRAIEQLHQAGSGALAEHTEHLLDHPDSRVRHRVLGLMGHHVADALLHRLALHDPDPALRETASRLAGHRAPADDLLQHPDLAVRQGALRGRLEVAPTDAQAQAHLAAAATSAQQGHRLMALALLGHLPPPAQAELVATCLHSPDPAVVQAAVHAVATTASPALVAPLIALLGSKAVRAPALDCLVQLGEVALAQLLEAFARQTSERCLHSLAQVCVRLATPAARQVLVEVAQTSHLFARAAAVRALASFATVPADAPLFHRLVEEEMELAQHLLHAIATVSTDLTEALRYELHRGQQRILGLLLQLYERGPLIEAQRSAAHPGSERQAAALEALDDLVPRPLYRGLQALLDLDRPAQQLQTLDDLLGPRTSAEPIQTTVVRRGGAAFSPWTIALALRQWHPQPATVAYLYPHLQTTDPLVRESAWALLLQLPTRRPAAYDHFCALYPALTPPAMTTHASTSCGTAQERVLLLKGTALFAATPENILSTIVPIMREVNFEPEQQIFAKGALGTSLFIICQGEVGVFNGPQQLATFHKGDFFGERALLDAEPRSATAVAHGHVVAFRLDQEDFYDVMEERSEVLRNILRVLCQRLRHQNERMMVA